MNLMHDDIIIYFNNNDGILDGFGDDIINTFQVNWETSCTNIYVVDKNLIISHLYRTK